MGKRNGGISKEKNSAPGNNDVFFHPLSARIMLKHIMPHVTSIFGVYEARVGLRVLDACANDGVLGFAFNNVFNGRTRLVCQDKKFSGESILDFKHQHKFDVILCNPPWVPSTFVEEVFWHLFDNLLDDGGLLIFIVNNPFFYQGADRAKKLGVYFNYFLPRFTFAWSGKSLLDASVCVKYKFFRPYASVMDIPRYIDLPRLKEIEEWERQKKT